MKVKVTELLNKLKYMTGVTVRNSPAMAFTGILFKEGFLYATNGEVSLKAKLDTDEMSAGETFFITAEATKLLNTLPKTGIVEIRDEAGENEGSHLLRISMDGIRSQYETMDPNTFPLPKPVEGASGVKIPADQMLRCIKSTRFAVKAAASTGFNNALGSLFLKAHDGILEFVGCNGQTIAVNRIEYAGDFQMMIPLDSIATLEKLPLTGDMRIEYDTGHAVFISDEYEFKTPLTSGDYVEYERFLKECRGEMSKTVRRKDLQAAVERAGLTEIKIRLSFTGNILEIKAGEGGNTYRETIEVTASEGGDARIFLDSAKLSAALAVFDSEEVTMNLTNIKTPIILNENGEQLEVLICPINPRPEEAAAA